MKIIIIILAGIFLIISCTENNDKSDAYGNFEAVETMISAEGQGKLLSFRADRGESFKKGDIVGVIDTTQLVLRKEQLTAQISAVSVQFQNIFTQTEVQEQQKQNLIIEQKRVEKLLADGAATSKQLDDINGQLKVLESSIDAVKSQNPAVFSNIAALKKQIEQINDQIQKCYVINPIEGIVLEKYIEPFEIVAPGKNLYKIADMSFLELKAYITGSQLSQIKLEEVVEVLIDKNKDENYKLSGIVSWISPKAEFTPKIIQTKEERVNLVYAIKVKVKNDGTLKIGMPAEINFHKEQGKAKK